MKPDDLTNASDEEIVKLVGESNVHSPEETGRRNRAVATVEMLRRTKDQMIILAGESSSLTKRIAYLTWTVAVFGIILATILALR